MRRGADRIEPRPASRTRDQLPRRAPTPTRSDVLAQIATLVGNRAFATLLQRADDGGAVGPSLLTDDDADVLGPGQVRKSEFLAYLKVAVVEVADDVLTPVGLAPDTCPYIPGWFGRYASQDAAHVERAIELYVPGATADGDWRSAASRVVARVRSALQTYVATGSLAGVPAEVAQIEVLGPGGRPVDPTLQRCGVKELKADKGKGGKDEPVANLEDMYNAGEPWVGKQYAVRRLPRDHPTNPFEQPVVVKMCPGHEQTLTERLSGHQNFPTYLGSGGNYLVTAYIGDYDAEPLLGGNGLGTDDLDQLVEIVRVLTEAGVAHEDMENNILTHKGRLFCIDLNCIPRGNKRTNLEATLSHATRMLGTEDQKTLRRRCAEFADL